MQIGREFKIQGVLPYGTESSGRTQKSAAQKGGGNAQELREKRRMLAQDRNESGSRENEGPKVFQGTSMQSVTASMQSYSEALKADRTKAKDTKLAVKHVRYQAKSISSQIVRSKTSTNCRQVVGKARREVVRLKRLRQNEAYDEEELQSAIVHAQAMERVAKKKLRHLEQEEAIRVTKDREASLEGEEERWESVEEEPAFLESEETEDYEQEELEWSEFEEMTESYLAEEGQEVQSELLEEMEEMLREFTEEMGLSDLMEELEGAPRREMDEEEFKEFRRKHRLAEMKELVKADSDYLKASFERMQRDSQISGSFGTGAGMPGALGVNLGTPGIGGGIDVSI